VIGTVVLAFLFCFCLVCALGAFSGKEKFGGVLCLLLSLVMLVGFLAQADSMRNIGIQETQAFRAGDYQIACQTNGNVLLVYQTWQDKNKSRAIFVPAASLKAAEPIAPCRNVKVSKTSFSAPDGNESFTLEAK